MDIVSSTVAASQRMRYHFARLTTAPQLTAVIDCLFELSPARTDPAFAELIVLDDQLVFARVAGEPTFHHYVGRREELVVNLLGFVKHLDLGETERDFVLAKIDAIERRRAA